MKISDLPIPKFKQPVDRSVYLFFWKPFGLCWGFVARFFKFSHIGLGFAALMWVFVVGFMYFGNALSFEIAFGLAIMSVLTGAVITALLTVFLD